MLSPGVNESQLDSIVEQIYAAAAGSGPWSAPLDAIARAYSLWAVQLVGVDKHNRALTYSHEGGALPPAAVLDYFREYHAISPRLPYTAKLEPGEWFHCHQQFDDAFVAADPFYQEYLIPHGGRYLSSTKIHEDENSLVILGLSRGVGQPPLSAPEVESLSRIARHLRSASRIHAHMRALVAGTWVGRQLLDEFTYPMLLIDEERAIVHANGAARDLLDAGDCLIDQGGCLLLRNPTDDKRLALAVHSLELGEDWDPSPGTPRRSALATRRSPGDEPVSLFVSAIRAQHCARAFGTGSLGLVVVHDYSGGRQFDPFVLREALGFTPAEARVAIGIAAGKTPADYASENRVSVATVRAQLNTIFVKLGISRQPDLVRLLASMPRLTLR